MPMKLLIADDHDLVRETISAYLQKEDGVEVSTASSLQDALEKVDGAGGFDVVLLDYDMPGMHGLAGLREMIAANSEKPVAIISGTASRRVAEEALKAGAAGFIPKTMTARSMVHAVQFMAEGEVFAPISFLQDDGGESALIEELTKREHEVLMGICEGKSNKEIARDCGLQEVTVKLHVKTLSRKLGAKNRTQAAMIAKDMNLV